MHSIVYDSVHDEIVVPQYFAQGILTFRGGVNGEEPPLRVIQGPLTRLAAPDQLAIDPVNNHVRKKTIEYPGKDTLDPHRFLRQRKFFQRKP